MYKRQEQSSNNDVTNAAENCENESGCRNGCETPLGPHVSTISRGEFLLPLFVRDDGSSSTLSSSSSSGVTETGSGKTNCSTPAEVGYDKSDLMTSSACAVRETAIVGDSSDERLDHTGNCPGDVTVSGDVILGASLIRQPLYETNSSHQSRSFSDLLNRDFVTSLVDSPETDILFSESVSDIGRNSHAKPEMKTYLRLPPVLPNRRDVKRLDNLPSINAESQDRTGGSRQPKVVEYPEVNSTASTTTTTMSLGRRSSSASAINRIGVDRDMLPSASCYRTSSIVDRHRRRRAPEAEVRRQLTSPLGRDAASGAPSASESRRARARALSNWAKVREEFRLRKFDVDEPHFQAAALRLLGDEVWRSQSFDRHVSRRIRRTSSSRDRRRCISTGSSTARHRSRGAQPGGSNDNGNYANNPAFRPSSDRHPQLSDPNSTAIPIIDSGSTQNIGATVDLAAAGASLPYDYEPLSFDDGGAGGPFSYMDDPFDYDDNGDHDNTKVTVPITICLIIIAGYIFAGAVLFTLWEDWDYFTGSYFCFITLSTIGFGDIVPGTDMDKWASSEKLVLCALWLAFGLSLLAMCFNLMQEEVKDKCKWIGLRLGLLRDDEPQ